jgi:hypothetical protein
MKNAILTIAMVTIIGLMYTLGNRQSSQAIVAVASALCGITAGIPVSLALFIASSRNWGRVEKPLDESSPRAPRTLAPNRAHRQRAAQRGVVMTSPRPATQTPHQFQPNPTYLAPDVFAVRAPREFKIVGDD